MLFEVALVIAGFAVLTAPALALVASLTGVDVEYHCAAM